MYDADYYLRGKETGKSLYENYRWMPELTMPMAKAICRQLGIERLKHRYSMLDFGAARGYLVKAMRELGVDCLGIDTSEWAVANCDPEVTRYMTCGTEIPEVDWIIAKDVLEHVPYVVNVVQEMLEKARRGIFVVVPLSFVDGGPYVVPEYEKDITHIHRLTLGSWARMFMCPGVEVTASYRVPGVKDNYASYWAGNGFITCKRLD